MTGLRRAVDRAVEVALAAILCIMVAAVALNVFGRYLLGASLAWSDELAQVLMVWMTFLGAALAYRRHELFSFDALAWLLPERASRILSALNATLIVSMTAALFYWSAEVAWQIRHWIMPATGVSRALVYGACPTGSALILFYALCKLVVGDQRPAEEHAGAELVA